MYKWISLIIALPILWAGYWIFGSYGLKSEINDWLTQRSTDGWQVEYSGLSIRGFPNRFDTTIENVQLTDPESGISWSAPFFQMLSLSYKPNHWIAVWPASHSFSTSYQSITISSQDTKASIVVKPEAFLPLQRTTLIAEDIALSSTLSWDIEADHLSASIRELETPNLYGVAIQVHSLTPSEPIRTWLNEKQNLPSQIEDISINLTTLLSNPIDQRTIDSNRPQILELSITEGKASWGELLLRLAGDITVDASGEISGELQISARNWRGMLAIAVSSGAIPTELAGPAEFGLGLIAKLNGSDQTLDTPLSFRNGKMFLGPISLGAAPNLAIR